MTHRFSSMLPQKSDNKKMAAHASTLLSTGVRHEKVKKDKNLQDSTTVFGRSRRNDVQRRFS